MSLLQKVFEKASAITLEDVVEPELDVQPGDADLLILLPDELKPLYTAINIRANALKNIREQPLMPPRVNGLVYGSLSPIEKTIKDVEFCELEKQLEAIARRVTISSAQRCAEDIFQQELSEVFPVQAMQAGLERRQLIVRKGWKIVSRPYQVSY